MFFNNVILFQNSAIHLSDDIESTTILTSSDSCVVGTEETNMAPDETTQSSANNSVVATDVQSPGMFISYYYNLFF